MPTRLCLFPPDAALALAPARVRLLRRTYDGLAGFDENDPIAIARAVSFRELPERTVDLFHLAIHFATDEGRDAIARAAGARKDLAAWVLLTPVDAAIDVARAAERGDEVARAVYARGRARVLTPGEIASFAPARVEVELVVGTPPAISPLESLLEAGRAVHGDRFVDGWVVECRTGTLYAVVVHEGRGATALTRPASPSAPVAPERSRGAQESAARRPRRSLACDAIRWDAAGGRVGFTLARASTLQTWRLTLGRVCAGDEGFFGR